MASALGDVTPYLVVLVAVATLGPLQFGYHLVRRNPSFLTLRQSS
jgi:hypothetical protein